MRRDPFKLRTPFFRSPIRRGVVTGACLGWSLVELYFGNGLWFGLFAVIGLYLAREFFILFDPKDYEDDA